MTEQPAAPPLSAAIETAEHFADYFFAVEDEEKRWRRLVRFTERRDAAIAAAARAQTLEQAACKLDEQGAYIRVRVMFPSAMANEEIPASDVIRALGAQPQPAERQEGS